MRTRSTSSKHSSSATPPDTIIRIQQSTAFRFATGLPTYFDSRYFRSIFSSFTQLNITFPTLDFGSHSLPKLKYMRVLIANSVLFYFIYHYFPVKCCSYACLCNVFHSLSCKFFALLLWLSCQSTRFIYSVYLSFTSKLISYIL